MAGMALDRLQRELDDLRKRVTTLEQSSEPAYNVQERLAALEAVNERRYRGKNPSEMHPGQYADFESSLPRTVQLRKPRATELWSTTVVLKRDTTALTIQAVGCTLNGTRDGSLVKTAIGQYRFAVEPGADGTPGWREVT